MPRIPVRTEPYTSPSRQHRHYKNKRDQVLRSLGKAAYINGSHFAIMWVSARGDVETYASEALQGRLDDWFVKRGVADEAKELVRKYRNNINRVRPPPQLFEADDEGFEEEDDDGGAGSYLSDEEGKSERLLRQPSMSSTNRPSATNTPLLDRDADVFTDQRAGRYEARPKLERSASTSMQSGLLVHPRRPIAPLDTNVANEEFHRSNASNGMVMQQASSFGMLPFRSPFGFENASMMESASMAVPPYSAPLRSEMHFPDLNSVSSLVKTTLKSNAARTSFLELRFSQLQQGMCKTVAKAWIKIIEPKKQTRCPYNKGEEGKPDWWPEGVRHKEPDHLMKPERHALLLTILRSPRVKVARLQLATAEVVALIKADKVSLLDDVYRIAREEEKMREGGMDLESAITIDVSTLEGWSEDGQCVVPVDRPQSPNAAGVEGEEDGLDAPIDGRQSTGKRMAEASVSRSASTLSSFKGSKRRASGSIVFQDASATNPSSSAGNADHFTRANHLSGNSLVNGPRRSQGAAQTWLLHEATQHGIKRTSVSSHTLSTQPHHAVPRLSAPESSNFLGHIGHQHGVQEQYGLVTPLTGNTQLMDPSFLSAAKEIGRNEDGSVDSGCMSAPVGHAHLFPHLGPLTTGTGPHHSYLYDLHLSRSSQAQSPLPHQVQQQQQQQQQSSSSSQQQQEVHQHRSEHQQQQGQGLFPYQQEEVVQGANNVTTSDGGALGLHGMGGVPWNAGAHNLSGTFGQNGENWWASSAMQRMANGAMGDASFDASFTSTVESGGPSTPPPPSNVMGQIGPGTGMTPSHKARAGAALIWNSQNQHSAPPQVLTSSTSSDLLSRSPNTAIATGKGIQSGGQQPSTHGIAPNAFESWVYAPQQSR